MRRAAVMAVVFCSVLLTERPSGAACGDAPGDASAIADARVAVDATCACDGFARHGDYVRCAGTTVRARVGDGLLPSDCSAAVLRCTSRSVCGRLGAQTCCRTSASGRTRCDIRRDAGHCSPPRGGTACVGAFTHCCDACTTSGCVPTTSTTTSTLPPCGGGPFACGGSCAAGLACAPISDFPPYCGCVPDGSQACESAQVPFCNGTCGAGGVCGPSSPFPQSPCMCVPSGTTPCGATTSPVCGGACAGSAACAPFRIDTLAFCACTDPDTTCGCGMPGACAAGEVCRVDPPCGCVP